MKKLRAAGWMRLLQDPISRDYCTSGEGVVLETAAAHQLGQSLVDRPHITVELRIGRTATAVASGQHQEVVGGDCAITGSKHLQIVSDSDCVK